MAGITGLEPATSAVTVPQSNQLIYIPKKQVNSYGTSRRYNFIVQTASYLVLLRSSPLPRDRIYKRCTSYLFIEKITESKTSGPRGVLFLSRYFANQTSIHTTEEV